MDITEDITKYLAVVYAIIPEMIFTTPVCSELSCVKTIGNPDTIDAVRYFSQISRIVARTVV